MKKLLLTLGAAASIAAPVAAVVACSSDDNKVTYGSTIGTTTNGTDVKGAFENHLTFGELTAAYSAHVDAGFSAEFKTAFDHLKTSTTGATTAATNAQTLVDAVEAFNSKDLSLPTVLLDRGIVVETDLFKAYKGKKIKAVLFFQDSKDKTDEAGSATYVKSADAAEWTSAASTKDFNEMNLDNKGFDSENKNHSIAGDKFGIRFDIVA